MKRLILFLCISFCLQSVYCQKKFTLSGFITDANNGETLIGATVYSKSLGQGVISNNYGFYSLTLPEGEYEISFSFIGYETQQKIISLKKDVNYDIEFKLSSIVTSEVTIQAKSIVEQTETSVIEVPIQQIKSIPALLGEVDVLKAIQLLPGVQSSEGTSGFYVRGGGPDQNLILLDGVPVYNSSHIGGLFSVFNADAIKTVRLTKGGFPARFGGRLSSVLEIDMKEGNMKEFHADVTLGLISSKIMLEGPVIKDKTSFIIAARRTYADLIVKPFLDEDTDLSLYFYDLNAKINHKISNKDRIYLSAYMGNDVFTVDFTEDDTYIDDSDPFGSSTVNESNSLRFGLGYGNITSTLRWNHLFNDKLFSNTTLTYSRYSFNTDFGLSNNVNFSNSDIESTEISFGYIAGIEDLGGRIDFDYSPNPFHNIKFGTSYTHHHFFPGETNLMFSIDEPGDSSDVLIDTNLNFSGNANVNELFFYIEDNVKITNRLKANVGLHVGLYSVINSIDPIGLNTYNYDKNLLTQLINIDNYSLQPRLSARYLLSESWSLKMSYAKMQQNIHLLSNSSVGFPSDIWVPAIDSVPSQTSHQIAGAITTQSANGLYELSLEGYYKTMSDLITYKEGYSNLQSTEAWQNAVETGGMGKSYGLELFLQKKRGKTTGWIGYTLSWTYRKFENINFNKWYPYKYDRRNDLSFVISHKFNEKWDVGATWVYGTGNAITFPQAIYFGMPNNWGGGNAYLESIEYYGERNATRLPNYHRLDFAINKHRKAKNWKSTISLGAYNLYNRKNPFFAYLAEENNERVAKQVSLFPIIPSISIRVQF